MFQTPIVLIIFNRPSLTEKVFKRIAKVRPSTLLVIADSPRKDYVDDIQKCIASRNIVTKIDWDCKVLMNYSDTNLGCRDRIISGLDWVFENVDEAIVLEDDCLPHPDFFSFCQEMLERYRVDTRIVSISGDNFQFGKNKTKDSYYFSRYPHIWGWATWRRAWAGFDSKMSLWHEVKTNGVLNHVLNTVRSQIYWSYLFEKAYQNKIDTWDIQWLFSCWINNQLAILPNVNLVSNIGFNKGALHTKVNNQFMDMRTEPMEFPLKHPSFMIRNTKADNNTENSMFSGKSILKLGLEYLNDQK